MKQFNHITLIQKHLGDVLNPAEQEAYDAWLVQPGNQELANDLRDIWDLSAKYQPTEFKPNAAAAFHKFKAEIRKESTVNTEPKIVRMKPMLWFSRIAASLVVLVACLFAFNHFNDVQSFNEEILAETIEQSTLNDGSEIWLDKDASLAVAKEFNSSERRLKLEGKAYFDVQRDEAKPFIVQMGENTLEVLGTSFNIDNSSENVIVEVESGVVKVSTNTEVKTLTANQRAVLNYENDQIEVTQFTGNRFTWYKNDVSLSSMEMEEAFEKIEDFYNVEINLSANVDRSCKVTSTLFKDSKIEDLLQVLKETHTMEYVKQDENIYLIKLLSCK